jgi:predicted TIM-barrel fold metal-dependent hydrolase
MDVIDVTWILGIAPIIVATIGVAGVTVVTRYRKIQGDKQPVELFLGEAVDFDQIVVMHNGQLESVGTLSN